MSEMFSAIHELFNLGKGPATRRNSANAGEWTSYKIQLANAVAFFYDAGKPVTSRIVEGERRRPFTYTLPNGEKWPKLNEGDYVGLPGACLTIEKLKPDWSVSPRAQMGGKNVIVEMDTGQGSAHRGPNVQFRSSGNNSPRG